MRQELESKLLFASPAELLLAEPASTETRRLLAHIGEQLGGAAPRLESADGGKYQREGAARAAVEAFYGGGGSGGSEAGGSSGSTEEGGGRAPAAALEAVQRLPPLVLRGLAHLCDHLRPFGLEAVLRLGSSFQEWAAAAEMRLSANTLRWAWGDLGRMGQLRLLGGSCMRQSAAHSKVLLKMDMPMHDRPLDSHLPSTSLQPAGDLPEQQRRQQGQPHVGAGPHAGKAVPSGA